MDKTTRGKILIVEDDLGTAVLHRNCLERRGFVAVSVATAEEAMQVVRDEDVRLIVLDYRLSDGTTGLQFCEALKALGCSVPVVIVTGYSQETTAVEALRAGVRDYVTKSPDYLNYLPEAVERILRQVDVERQLADSESRLAAIINSSHDAIIVIDDQDIITLFNPAAEEIFQCRQDRAVGTSVKRFFPEEVSIAFGTMAFQSASTVPATVRTPHWRIDGVRTDGTAVPLELAVSYWVEHNKTFSTLVIRDITQQKQAEEMFRKCEQQLRKTQKLEALGMLAGGIAHKFNNLHQAIQGHATFAIQGLSANEQRFKDLKQLLKAVHQASALTKQILGVGRCQSLQLAEIDLNRVVQDLASVMRPLVGSQVNIAFALDENIGTVLADSNQLREMLMNLCVNAREAMSKGGNLLLRTEHRVIGAGSRPMPLGLQPGHYVVVTVRDDGCGMTDHVKEHLFEPFFTTKEVGKGTGLGLALVFGIVEQHGGAIDVRSDLGRGTTFEVYLPCSSRTALTDSQSDARVRSDSKSSCGSAFGWQCAAAPDPMMTLEERAL